MLNRRRPHQVQLLSEQELETAVSTDSPKLDSWPHLVFFQLLSWACANYSLLFLLKAWLCIVHGPSKWMVIYHFEQGIKHAFSFWFQSQQSYSIDYNGINIKQRIKFSWIFAWAWPDALLHTIFTQGDGFITVPLPPDWWAKFKNLLLSCWIHFRQTDEAQIKQNIRSSSISARLYLMSKKVRVWIEKAGLQIPMNRID